MPPVQSGGLALAHGTPEEEPEEEEPLEEDPEEEDPDDEDPDEDPDDEEPDEELLLEQVGSASQKRSQLQNSQVLQSSSM